MNTRYISEKVMPKTTRLEHTSLSRVIGPMKDMTVNELSILTGDAKRILISQFVLYIKRNHPSVKFDSDDIVRDKKFYSLMRRAETICSKRKLLSKKNSTTNPEMF